MTVKAQEMQHHARLLRGERNKWQRHFGILAIAFRIHGQRDVPADHPELHALLISVRQVVIERTSLIHRTAALPLFTTMLDRGRRFIIRDG